METSEIELCYCLLATQCGFQFTTAAAAPPPQPKPQYGNGVTVAETRRRSRSRAVVSSTLIRHPRVHLYLYFDFNHQQHSRCTYKPDPNRLQATPFCLE